jgi:hypothetical protein
LHPAHPFHRLIRADQLAGEGEDLLEEGGVAGRQSLCVRLVVAWIEYNQERATR